MIDNLRAVLSRRGFSEQEISVFRGVINSLDRFPRKRPKPEPVKATDGAVDQQSGDETENGKSEI